MVDNCAIHIIGGRVLGFLCKRISPSDGLGGTGPLKTRGWIICQTEPEPMSRGDGMTWDTRVFLVEGGILSFQEGGEIKPVCLFFLRHHQNFQHFSGRILNTRQETDTQTFHSHF